MTSLNKVDPFTYVMGVPSGKDITYNSLVVCYQLGYSCMYDSRLCFLLNAVVLFSHGIQTGVPTH